MTRRLRRHEDHVNHEAWAIPYADLLTLLLAFFVVMYAISVVNEGKYRVLSDSLFAAFRGTPRTLEPIQIGKKEVGPGSDLATTMAAQAALSGQPHAVLTPVLARGGLSGAAAIPKAPGGAAAAALARVADEVERAMSDLVRQNLVKVRRTDYWIEVEIRTDILFPSGRAQLSPNAVEVIERVADVLAPFPNPIRVEGHTDNRPISTVAFYSNWELSAARAGSVVRVLQGRGVAPERLAVIGYGEQRPIQGNDTETGRNANRRVVVVILSTELAKHNDPADLPTAQNDPAALQAPVAEAAAATPTGATTALPQGAQAVPAEQAVPGTQAVPTAQSLPNTATHANSPTPPEGSAIPTRPAPAP